MSGARCTHAALESIRDTLLQRTRQTHVQPDGTRETVEAPERGAARVPREAIATLLAHEAVAPMVTADHVWLRYTAQRVSRGGPLILLSLEYIRCLLDLVLQLLECDTCDECGTCHSNTTDSTVPSAPIDASASNATDVAIVPSGTIA